MLTELVIGANEVGQKGATALSEALKVNKVLSEFGLAGNPTGNAGAFALASALRLNAALTVLDVRHNSIGTEGGKAIAEALKVNGGGGTHRVLEEISLMDNAIGEVGLASLGKAVRANAITAPHLREQAGRSAARVAAPWI